MKTIKIIIEMILVLTFQSTFANSISILGITPDFVLIFVVHMALRHGAVVGVFTGFLCGLTEDIYGPVSYLGAATLSKLCVGYFVGQLNETFIKLDFIPKIIVLTISFFVSDFIYSVGASMSKESISYIFMHKSLPEGLYTLVVGVIIFYLLDLINKRK